MVFADDGTVTKIVGDAIHAPSGGAVRRYGRSRSRSRLGVGFGRSTPRVLRLGGKRVALGVTRIGAHAGPAIVGNFVGGLLLGQHSLRRDHQHRGAAGSRSTNNSAPGSALQRNPRGKVADSPRRPAGDLLRGLGGPAHLRALRAQADQDPRQEATWRHSPKWWT